MHRLSAPSSGDNKDALKGKKFAFLRAVGRKRCSVLLKNLVKDLKADLVVSVQVSLIDPRFTKRVKNRCKIEEFCERVKKDKPAIVEIGIS